MAVQQVADEQRALARASTHTAHTLQAQEFLQELAQAVQQQAHGQIARVVSKCLSAVFETRYELLIKFHKLRGKTEAELVYLKNGQEIDPEVDSGGVREVADLACRLSSLVLSLPQAQKVLILDEPFRGVDAENLPKVAELLKTLSVELGIQWVISTHDQALIVGKVIQL